MQVKRVRKYLVLKGKKNTTYILYPFKMMKSSFKNDEKNKVFLRQTKIEDICCQQVWLAKERKKERES